MAQVLVRDVIEKHVPRNAGEAGSHGDELADARIRVSTLANTGTRPAHWNPERRSRMSTAAARTAEVPPPAAMNLDDFLHFAEQSERRWQLISGTPVVTPPEHNFNRTIAANLFARLLRVLEPDRRVLIDAGLVTQQCSPATALSPDLVILRDGVSGHDRYASPDQVALVVEVLSPSTRDTDLGTKRREYARAGIPVYLVIDRHAPTGERFTLLTDPTDGNYQTAVTADEVTLTIDGTDVAVSAADLLR